MRDTRFPKGLFNSADNFFGPCVLLQHEMSSQGNFRGADGPDVDVMDAADAGRVFHPFLHIIGVNALRDGIKAHPEAF